MQFVYRCPIHGDFEEDFRIGQAPNAVVCCSVMALRVFTAPQFTEDRRRFGRDGISPATGMRRAQSRDEAKRQEKALGIEFMAKDEVPAHLQNARAYGAHLKAGKPALPPDVAAALCSPPPEPAPSLVEALRKNPKRLGELPSDRPIQGKPLPPFPRDVPEAIR